MTRISAVILAGGKAERLGGINKALIEIAGTTLLERAISAARGCEPVLLAIGHTDFSASGVKHVRDIDAAYAGPLAGVAAAVEQLLTDPPDLLLSMAVDTPFFPHDFRARASLLIDGRDAVLGAFAGQDYPTNALWRFEAIRGLPAAVRAGDAPHSLKRLAEGLATGRLDYAEVTDEDPFANANTPEDLAILRVRAASK